jgi:hypothetical protein
MQDYDINLAPGAVRRIDAQADYIYYRSGSAGGADAAIEFAPVSGGESIFLYPGQAYRVPNKAGGMGYGWTLKNRKGEATIIGVVILGEGQFEDNRISGSVEVIDGGKARTMAGLAFSGAYGAGYTPGNYSRLSLWNPAGSGKNVILEAIALSSGAALTVNLYKSDAPATGGSSNGQGKLLNGNALVSTAQVIQDSNQPALGSNGTAIWQLAVVANGKDLWKPTEPIVVQPGRALMAWGLTAGADFALSLEWFEESAL